MSPIISQLEALGVSPITGRKRRWIPLDKAIEVVMASTELKDAQRYRYLRNADVEAIHKGGIFAGQTPQNLVINEEDLDIAIDTAMKSTPSDDNLVSISGLPKSREEMIEMIADYLEAHVCRKKHAASHAERIIEIMDFYCRK